MPVHRFTFANIASALIWAPALLFAGWLTATTIGTLRLGRTLEVLLGIGIIVAAALGIAAAKKYRAHRSPKK
jgi:membrane protein DedA with SNARE-associated domain